MPPRTVAMFMPEDEIRAHAGSNVFERGRNYFRSGQVRSLVLRGDVLSAAVQGSEPFPYDVSISVQGGRVTSASCSCPYGGWCKHVVATLLAVTAHPGAVETRPPLVTRLAALDAEALRTLVLELAARDHATAEAVERLLERPSVSGLPPAELPPVDTTAIDRRIARAVGSLSRMRSSEAY